MLQRSEVSPVPFILLFHGHSYFCSYINSYLSKPDVRELLGVDPAAPANFSAHNGSIAIPFRNNLDHYFPTQYYIGALLERGVRALILVGSNDWICNWVSQTAYLRGMLSAQAL